MSLQPVIVRLIPEDTAPAVQTAFPKGHRYLRLDEALGPLYSDQQFAALFPTRGQPGISPAQLALVTVLQFAEGLSDAAAVEAVQSRLDWKYLLRLPVGAPAFDPSVLSEFRSRLLAGGAEQLLLTSLLERCREQRLLKVRGQQRTDSTHVLAAIHGMRQNSAEGGGRGTCGQRETGPASGQAAANSVTTACTGYFTDPRRFSPGGRSGALSG